MSRGDTIEASAIRPGEASAADAASADGSRRDFLTLVTAAFTAVGTGAITSVPLLLFAGAARRLPLVTLGLIQYVAPSIQFLVGYFLLGEPLTPARILSFGFIWAALALFVADSLRAARRA